MCPCVFQEDEFNSTSDLKCKELDSYLGSSHVSAYLKKDLLWGAVVNDECYSNTAR